MSDLFEQVSTVARANETALQHEMLKLKVIEHLIAWNEYNEKMHGYRYGGASMADVNHSYNEFVKSISNLQSTIK